MRCPHCTVHFFNNWEVIQFHKGGHNWEFNAAYCPECLRPIIAIRDESRSKNWKTVYPIESYRAPPPNEVPKKIAADFVEACSVLSLSPKASAALARRCLQAVLSDQGYAGRTLMNQIEAFLIEADPRKVAPAYFRTNVDAIRNFGNFSAHPITDVTTFQIIEVEPEEAEWCLEIIEELFDHFYVRPAQIAAKRAELDVKLKAAGKPPSNI